MRTSTRHGGAAVRRTLVCAAWATLAGSALVGGLEAAEPNSGHGSSAALRQDAQRHLPLQRLTPNGRAATQRVLDDVAVFRRLPSQTIECDAEMYGFLIENPDLVINIWEVMGVTKVSLRKTGPSSFHLDDGNGTVGDLHYIYRSPTQHVIFCEGTYTGSLFPRPIRGRCLISLRSTPHQEAQGRALVQCKLDSFVQMDNLGVEMFARTFHNVLGGIADHNFREVAGFVASVSQAAESAPENLHQIAERCRRVPPTTTQRFVAISDRIFEDAAATTRSTGQPPRTAMVRRPFSDDAQR